MAEVQSWAALSPGGVAQQEGNHLQNVLTANPVGHVLEDAEFRALRQVFELEGLRRRGQQQVVCRNPHAGVLTALVFLPRSKRVLGALYPAAVSAWCSISRTASHRSSRTSASCFISRSASSTERAASAMVCMPTGRSVVARGLRAQCTASQLARPSLQPLT